MATEPLIRSEPPLEPSEAEYLAFCETLMTTGRGRWFLAEYARRHRKATAQDALDTLARIEGRLQERVQDSRAQHDPNPAAAHVFEELRSLAGTIRHARLDIGWSDSEFSKGAKVMALLELLEDRIAGLIDDSAADFAAPAAPEEKAEPRVQLTVVTANPAPGAAAAPGALASRARNELPAIDFTAATVVMLPQLALAAPAAKAEIVIAVATEPSTSTLAFPEIALYQPFEMEKAGKSGSATEGESGLAAPVDFAAEPFDPAAVTPAIFETPIAFDALSAADVAATPEVETADVETADVETATAEPTVAEIPAIAPPVVASQVAAPQVAAPQVVVPAAPPPAPVIARRKLPPNYDPMTPVRALSADERIALVS